MASNNLKRKTEPPLGSGGKKAFGHWSQGLKSSMDDPNLRVYDDDRIVIIKDKYPKAKFHFLVLPKESITTLKAITQDKIPLLNHMYEKGKEIATKQNSALQFRYGYHAIPSMSQVHLHVISQDFDSPSLKTKKHWNSFTTEYFIDSDDVISMIEEDGKFSVDTSRYSELLKKSIECHKCDKEFKTMPNLKKHLLCHIPKSAT